MSVKNLEVSKLLILPKSISKKTGCYLFRDGVIYNGFRFKFSSPLIQSIKMEYGKLFVKMDDDICYDDIYNTINFCKNELKAKSVIIENIRNREKVVQFLKPIYKKETLGLYLKSGIVVTDF